MCSVGSHTVFVYCCSGQTWKEDCSTLYFRKDYWKARTGARHVCDWRKFLNELIKLWKTYFWEKCLDFILEKKENLFQLFDDSGGGKKKKKNISAPFSSFYSKGKKISLRFLTLVAPLGTLLSFISPSLLMDDESIPSPSLSFFFIFICFLCRHFGWIGGRGTGEEPLIDMCHPLCFFQVPVQQSHPSIPLTSSVSTLYSPF